jgi:ribonuclease P protein subunit POP4
MDENRIVKDELIGRHVKIKECTDPAFVNVSGMVIDETKNTFLIETEDKQKRIAKKTATFEFEYKEKKITVKGSRLIYRPEDRTKKAR